MTTLRDPVDAPRRTEREPLLVAAAPHLKGRDSVATIMWNGVASLVPLIAASAWFFGVSALLVVLTRDEVRGEDAFPCIHCGRCLDACPMFLNPSLLGDLARAGRYEAMDDEHLADCMLCGSCSYVCPSNIPLAQLFNASKTALRKRKAAGA